MLFVVEPELLDQTTLNPWEFPLVTQWYHVHKDGLRYVADGELWFASREAAEYNISSNQTNPLISSTTAVNLLAPEERVRFVDAVWTVVPFTGTVPAGPPVEVVVPADGDPTFVVDPRRRFPEQFHAYVDEIPQTTAIAKQDDPTGGAPVNVIEVTAPPPPEDNTSAGAEAPIPPA